MTLERLSFSLLIYFVLTVIGLVVSLTVLDEKLKEILDILRNGKH